MRKAGFAGITMLALGSMLTFMPGARAAAGDAAEQMPMYQGMARSVPQCPAITWMIHPVGAAENGGLSGVLWYADMSGVSLARGMMQKNGTFSLNVSSVSGAGPTGTVTGTRGASGVLTADLNGPGCAKLHVNLTMMSMPMYNMAGNGG